jgi:hypothetical protein
MSMRWPRLLAVLVSSGVLAAGLAAGIDQLADLTQDRPDPVEPGSRTTVTFKVTSRLHPTGQLADAQALWGACQGTSHAVALEPGVEPAGPGRFAVTVTPRLGAHAARRLRGCLEDVIIDRVQAQVVDLRDQPPQAAQSPAAAIRPSPR